MAVVQHWSALVMVWLTMLHAGQCSIDRPSKLLLLMLDGFRWDYIQENTPGFRQMALEGVKAEYTIPVFPSVTLTNWMSLFSGTFPETHGLINNYIYDKKHDAYLLLSTFTKNIDWNFVEGIHTQAVRKDKSVYMYHWAGCPLPYKGVVPQYCSPSYPSPGPSLHTFNASAHEALQALRNDSADFAIVYLELVDVMGHFYGPHSDPVIRTVQSIGDILASLLRQVKNKGAVADTGDGINVILSSDHGMTGISPSRIVNISETLQPGDVKIVLNSPPITFVWPEDNATEQVYRKLKSMHPRVTAYLKEELPARWYIADSYRVPPITLVADLGWSMIEAKDGYPVHDNNTYDTGSIPLLGYHGYDVTESDMRGIFMAYGPAFKRGYAQPGLRTVDIYQVLCEVLGLEPHPHNGTWANVKGMLAQDDTHGSSTARRATLFIIILSLLVQTF